MLTTLTTSRLSLASTASQNLTKLITKLEAAVSIIPEPPTAKPEKLIDFEEEEDEDPSELFHRDIGVQTSPPHSRSSSPSPATRPSLVASHVERLQVLKTHLQEIQTDSAKEGENTGELEGTMGVLREYLDGFAYSVPSYTGNYGFVGAGGSRGKDEDDEIGRVKAGIRGVKGVLLSARSFPGV
ncbi:hypothetical protein LOCC1_G005541 [Lachnellula occidentalis]|uniref:Peroxin-14 n=1 Tax=Lachnellula occidentalis TaxID=215460 RepID=A0A8H8UDI6_9HELO|nr:hypothetical protein LOCC1_G005541 [Lachnellula occidentalis]